MGAAYVLYQPVAIQKTLILPSLLMFGTGLLKYGERTWALKCANIDSIRSSLDVSDDRNRRQPYDGRVRTAGELDSEEILLGAHYIFNACKSLFTDDLITSGTEREAITTGIEFNGGKYMYELIEMQLSLMYDILYTKAAVIYTWYGSCIRVISPAATLVSFLLFELNSSHAYAGQRRNCDRTELRSRIAKKVGLEKWWNKIHYSSTIKISDSIRDLLLKEIPRRPLGDMRNARGRWTLQKIRYPGGGGSLYDEISWSVNDTDFDQSILIWHVATDVYLCCRRRQPAADGVEEAERLAKAVKELSDYMLFLYVVQPHMLPGPVRSTRYDNNCDDLVTLWEQHSTDQNMDSALTPRENLARLLYREYRDKYDDDDASSPAVSVQMEDNNPHGLAYIDAAGLAGMLLSEGSGIPDVLEMIAGVWIEMLCYATRHCSEVSHAKQLSSGGELVTAMGLLVEYTARYGIHGEVTTKNGEPGMTAAEVSVHLDSISITGATGEICEEPDGMNAAANGVSEDHGHDACTEGTESP
uniref:DUF4220 domain-containing protein n=1 Tax=Setaria italica TaxID=4555 RepID=K4A8D6_SETIT